MDRGGDEFTLLTPLIWTRADPSLLRAPSAPLKSITSSRQGEPTTNTADRPWRAIKSIEASSYHQFR